MKENNVIEYIKKGITLFGILLTTLGSITENKTFIIVGGLISAFGALMIAALK